MINRGRVLELFNSQAELARVCGVNRATINGWKGSDKPVQPEYVASICRAAMDWGMILTPQMLRPDLWPNPLGGLDGDK